MTNDELRMTNRDSEIHMLNQLIPKTGICQ